MTLSEDYEEVYTVSDYWDGPLKGVADFHGKPHRYEREFDEERDDWSNNTYVLQEVDDEILSLDLEMKTLSRKYVEGWKASGLSFHAYQKISRMSPFPVPDELAADLEANEDGSWSYLKECMKLKSRYEKLPVQESSPKIRAIGRFRVSGRQDVPSTLKTWHVRWEVIQE